MMNCLFFTFFFYHSTALSSHTVDGHQMYSGGLVVDKASLIDPKRSCPPLPLFSQGVKKCEIWRHFQHHSALSHLHLKMQQGSWTRGVARNLLGGTNQRVWGRKTPAGSRGRIWKPQRTPTGPWQKLTYGDWGTCTHVPPLATPLIIPINF